MATIKIPCNKCGNTIEVNIKTIDALKKELEWVKKERDDYKAKCAALEYMRKNKKEEGLGDWLKDYLK